MKENTPAPGLEPNAGDWAVKDGGKVLGVLEPGPRSDTGLQRPSPGSKSDKTVIKSQVLRDWVS